MDQAVTPSLAEILSRADRREPLHSADSLSGAPMERLQVDGRWFVLKHLGGEGDWIARASGDLGRRQVSFWEAGGQGLLPDSIDSTVVAWGEDEFGAALLMHDVGEYLVQAGSEPLADVSHAAFLRDMARLHAATAGLELDPELMPLSHGYLTFHPLVADLEARRGGGGVPAQIGIGWRQFPSAAPRCAPLVAALQRDLSPLLAGLERGPHVLVHSDWKLGNLGRRPDGRTILLDWDRCCAAPPPVDLAWYLAVNCDRLLMPKEEAIRIYRTELENAGLVTGAWWDEQLALALLGGLLQLGWAKAGGDPAELAWWEDRALEAWEVVG